ncbi:hypothetical protein NC653_025548 [Populus alba x Populus x berolinensis]|uniref:Uncharacterized protein n=1 Tax=Populus alba x Populus x berolinensis TaxID=444605 RepID=A0AAD6MC19_9ROSI|nr:hypothetical protein NC653_025548 [Populus alba x Populus x berolinensis]
MSQHITNFWMVFSIQKEREKLFR